MSPQEYGQHLAASAAPLTPEQAELAARVIAALEITEAAA